MGKLKVRRIPKTVGIGFAAALTLPLALTACGSGGGDSEAASGGNAAATLECAQETAADTQFKAAEPVEFNILWTDWPENPITDTWEIFDEIEARTNVRLVPTHIPWADRYEKTALLISSGDAPEIIPLTYPGEELQYAASGAVLPLSQYADYMPNFEKYLNEWDLTEQLEALRQADGEYYLSPGLKEVSVPAFSIIIRKDIFDEVGAGIPDTWDEMYDALKKIKEKYPDSYPLGDGFEGQSMLNYTAHGFETKAGWGFGNGAVFNNETGQFEYAGSSEGYKEMLQMFNKFYEEGLLDEESFTQKNDGAGTVQEKVAQEKIFASSGASGTVQELEVALDANGVTDYELMLIPPLAGPKGPLVEPKSFWNGFMLTTDAKDNPQFCTMVQFLDWLYYNQDARELVQWGVEGKHYTKDEEGNITINPEFKIKSYNMNMEAGTIDLNKDLGYANAVLAGATESRKLAESYNTPLYVEYMDNVLASRTPRPADPAAPLTEDELETTALVATPLKDAVDTASLEFILGQRSFDDWDAYVAELESRGLSGYMQTINDAKTRFDSQK